MREKHNLLPPEPPEPEPPEPAGLTCWTGGRDGMLS